MDIANIIVNTGAFATALPIIIQGLKAIVPNELLIKLLGSTDEVQKIRQQAFVFGCSVGYVLYAAYTQHFLDFSHYELIFGQLGVIVTISYGVYKAGINNLGKEYIDLTTHQPK